MRFETFQQYCKYSGFCNIICSHPSRPKMLPPFSPLCSKKKCPIFKDEIDEVCLFDNIVENEDL